MKNIINNFKTQILVTVLLVFIVVTISNKEASARVVWEMFHLPSIALMIDKDAELSFDVGNYYFNTGGSGVYNQNRAEKYFAKTLLLDPDHKYAQHQLSRIYFLRGDFGKALETINTQIALHGDSVVSSYYVRGLIYGFLELLDEAEQDFLHFVSVRSRNWGGYNDLAWIYFQKGEYEKTLEYADKGLLLAPINPWLLTTKGVALMNLGRNDEAVSSLERALELTLELNPHDWSQTNPGNDPRIAEEGLWRMKNIIEENLELAVHK